MDLAGGKGKTLAATTSDINLCSSNLKAQQCETTASVKAEDSSRLPHQSSFSG